jgi:hypothetical protein
MVSCMRNQFYTVTKAQQTTILALETSTRPVSIVSLEPTRHTLPQVAAHRPCHRVHIYYDTTITKIVLELIVFISDFLLRW